MTPQEEAFELLRLTRNFLLQETERNGKGLFDRPFTEEEINYRQQLRDLPATADPQLDENGNLTNVTWPTKPGENT